MQGTYISPIPRPLVQRVDAGSRLNWLIAANEYEAKRRGLFRNPFEEEQMLLMRRTVSTEKAYSIFGLLLGALPPAAILYRLFGYGLGGGTINIAESGGALFFLCEVINVVCGIAGYAMGSTLSRTVLRVEHSSWKRMMVLVPLLGAAWGAITGVAGGFFFFGIGGFAGWAIGIPVGCVGFLLFAVLHRLLERGGMIEAHHFVPVACGITAILTASILGL